MRAPPTAVIENCAGYIRISLDTALGRAPNREKRRLYRHKSRSPLGSAAESREMPPRGVPGPPGCPLKCAVPVRPRRGSAQGDRHRRAGAGGWLHRDELVLERVADQLGAAGHPDLLL